MRLLSVLVEGDHDVVFVDRALQSFCGYVPFTRKLEDYPRPLGGGATSFLLSYVRRAAQERLTLADAKMVPRPGVDVALHDPNGDTLALVFNTGGVDRDASALLSDLDAGLSTPSLNEFTSAAFLFCVDADNVGAAARASAVARAHGALLGVSSLSHATWSTGASYRVGIYVFAAPGQSEGALEDHLVPMVRAARPEEFAAAAQYLDGCATPRDKLRGKPTSRAKALITCAGQFEWPGHPMAKMIRYNALHRDVFLASAGAKEFADFVAAL